MADEKPKGKGNLKPDSAPKERDVFVDIVSVLFAFFILSSLISGVTRSVNGDPLWRNGLQGLTPHAITLAYTRSLASVFNPIGASVLVSRDSIDVLNDAGGSKIGNQSFGVHGKVLQGPVMVAGINYYYVDFDSGTDGWVNENDIAYVDSQPSVLATTILFMWTVFGYMSYVLWIVIILIIILLVYIVRELTKIRVNNRQKLYPILAVTDPQISANPKWERVLTHIESLNENDWRLAIIEADIMMAELLDTMHLVGDTIGEKLKGIEKSDFTTLDLAWEAHKVRNQIAHAGGDFRITQREALRVIELYSKVFKEFQYI